MNTLTVRASSRCSRFQEKTAHGTTPFVRLVHVEDLFDTLRGNPRVARQLVGRLRDESKGCAVIHRWLLAIADVFEASREFARDVLTKKIERRARERNANRRLLPELCGT